MLFSILVHLAGCTIDHLGLFKLVLLHRLLDARVFLWVDFALRSRSCQDVDVIYLYTCWLVLDSLPGNSD